MAVRVPCHATTLTVTRLQAGGGGHDAPQRCGFGPQAASSMHADGHQPSHLSCAWSRRPLGAASALALWTLLFGAEHV